MNREEYAEAMLHVKAWPPWLLYAKTLWGEARGEPREGKIAVCWVMHRRQMDGQLWNDILSPWQFSCYNFGDPNFELLYRVGINDTIFQECIDIAFGVINGNYSDPTNGANHYFNGNLIRPAWADKMLLMAKLGHHEFYRDKA